MPAHVLHARHNPPTVADKTAIHSSDVTLAAAAVMVAVQVLLTALIPSYEPSPSLEGVNEALGLSLAAFAATGGTLWYLGLVWPGETVSVGWALERAGCWLTAGAWGAYATVVAIAYPEATISWSIPAVLALGALARSIVVWRIEQHVRPAAARARSIRERISTGEQEAI